MDLDLPPWLATTTKALMNVAETVFGPHSGPAKKAWVRNALIAAARLVDVPEVPNWIEDPAKVALIDFLIEAIWSLDFRNPSPGAAHALND